MMIGGRHRPETEDVCNFFMYFKSTLLWFLQYRLELTTEVDILSEQDALFRLSLFNLKQLSWGTQFVYQDTIKQTGKLQNCKSQMQRISALSAQITHTTC